MLTAFAAVSIGFTLFVGTSCIISLVTGFPCPACGMTRANLLAITFRFKEAFAMNPLFFYSVIVLAGLVLVTAKPEIAFRKWFTATCIVLTVVLIAAYIVRMILLFPSTPPLVYRFESLLGILIRFFQNVFAGG